MIRVILRILAIIFITAGVFTFLEYPAYGTEGRWVVMIISFLAISVLGSLFILSISLSLPEDMVRSPVFPRVIILAGGIIFFFLSWLIIPPPGEGKNYSIMESDGEKQVISGTYFFPPYGKDFTHIGNEVFLFSIEEKVTDEKEALVREVEVFTKLIASKEDVFRLALLEHSSAEQWKKRMCNHLEQGIRGIIDKEDKLLTETEIELPEDVRKKVLSLGYEIEKAEISSITVK